MMPDKECLSEGMRLLDRMLDTKNSDDPQSIIGIQADLIASQEKRIEKLEAMVLEIAAARILHKDYARLETSEATLKAMLRDAPAPKADGMGYADNAYGYWHNRAQELLND